LNKKNIFICCTEQSGENICYNILQRLDLKNINVDGVCGSRSEKYFKHKYYDISEFKSIGLFEVIFSLRKYLKMIKLLNFEILKKNYDLVICIDSPDFNYQLAKSLRKYGFSKKIIQIVAPTVWAWRPRRSEKFAKLFNEIFLLFNFEKKYFQFKNFTSTFIGHPVFHINKRPEKINYQYIAFLFGSRENEIKKLFKYFDTLEKYISLNKPNLKILIPTLPHLVSIIKKRTANWKSKILISSDINNFDKLYEDVFISVTCSGTASLEVAKRNIPQIVVYKLNFFTEFILKFFVKVNNACILNIISKKIIIPELVNSKLTNKNLINEFTKLVNDENYRKNQINNINVFMPHIITEISPYEISSKRILSLI